MMRLRLTNKTTLAYEFEANNEQQFERRLRIATFELRNHFLRTKHWTVAITSFARPELQVYDGDGGWVWAEYPALTRRDWVFRPWFPQYRLPLWRHVQDTVAAINRVNAFLHGAFRELAKEAIPDPKPRLVK